MHGMNNITFEKCWGRFQLGHTTMSSWSEGYSVWFCCSTTLWVCESVLVTAVPASRCGDTSPGALLEGGGGVQKRRSEHGSSAGIADCRLQSAIIPPNSAGLHEIHHTSRSGMTPIIEHEFGKPQMAAVGALDTAGHASRSSQNRILGAGGTWRYPVSRQYQPTYLHYNSVPQKRLLADPFWLRKITTDLHMLAHVSTQGPDFCTFSEPYIVTHIREKDQQMRTFLSNLFHFFYPRHVSNKIVHHQEEFCTSILQYHIVRIVSATRLFLRCTVK
jgi:hypothetical protein